MVDKKREFKIDVPGKISELNSLLKKFMIRNVSYKMLFRGKGLEFDSYRDYSPDEDSESIDWKASRRANKILVKKYVEERDLKIMFLIDIGENMVFGSTEKLKCEYNVELFGALSHLILDSGDRVGMMLFSDSLKKTTIPSLGERKFGMMIEEISNPDIYGGSTDIEKSLNQCMDYLKKDTSSVIIISDFLKMKRSAQEVLRLFSSRFETMAIMVKDPLDRDLPDIKGEVVIGDYETGEKIVIDPSISKKAYEAEARRQEKMVEEIFEDADIDVLRLDTSEDFSPALSEFLRSRLERKQYVLGK